MTLLLRMVTFGLFQGVASGIGVANSPLAKGGGQQALQQGWRGREWSGLPGWTARRPGRRTNRKQDASGEHRPRL